MHLLTGLPLTSATQCTRCRQTMMTPGLLLRKASSRTCCALAHWCPWVHALLNVLELGLQTHSRLLEVSTHLDNAGQSVPWWMTTLTVGTCICSWLSMQDALFQCAAHPWYVLHWSSPSRAILGVDSFPLRKLCLPLTMLDFRPCLQLSPWSGVLHRVAAVCFSPRHCHFLQSLSTCQHLS